MLITTHSMQKEYEQIIRTPFVFRQVKPALWKAPLRVAFLILFISMQCTSAATGR